MKNRYLIAFFALLITVTAYAATRQFDANKLSTNSSQYIDGWNTSNNTGAPVKTYQFIQNSSGTGTASATTSAVSTTPWILDTTTNHTSGNLLDIKNNGVSKFTIDYAGVASGSFTGNASTATALAANGANCSAGSYPLGVSAAGAAESCTVAGYSASSASLGGSALTIGTCATNATTVTGATTAMAVVVTPATYPGAEFYWRGYVSAADEVTTTVCSVASATPTASVYRIRVIP